MYSIIELTVVLGLSMLIIRGTHVQAMQSVHPFVNVTVSMAKKWKCALGALYVDLLALILGLPHLR